MSQHIANQYFQHPLKSESNRRIKTLYSMNDSNSCKIRKVIVPKNISMDKETLYEQLHSEKLKIKQLNLENQQLKSILLQFEKETEMLDESDQRKVISQSLIKLKQKDQEIQKLKENAQYRTSQLLTKQMAEMRRELLKYQILQKFDGDQNQIVQDNINLIEQLESQKKYITDLEKMRTDYIQIKAKYNQLQQVLKLKDQQINFRQWIPISISLYLLILQFKDLLSEVNLLKHHSKNEGALADELSIKLDEIQHLQMKLNQCHKLIQENQNMYNELSFDSKQKIAHLEAEKKSLNDKFTKLQFDHAALLEKQKQLDKYLQTFQKKKLQTQTLIYGEDQLFQSPSVGLVTPISSPHDDHMVVKQVKKQQIDQTVLELKLSLRKKRISLQDAELILFMNDIISINELEKTLKYDPFNLKNSTLLARYLVEDYSDKEFIYDPELKAPQAQIKSVFRTLFQNYKLSFDEQTIETVQKAIKNNIDGYFGKKDVKTITLENIQECMISQDIQWTSKHSDYLQQAYYNKYNKYLCFDINNLLKLFDKD